jgi:hypothetical protein
MDELRKPVPVVLGGRQFQDLGMAPGQTPLLPAHPFTGADVEMAAGTGDVLTNVEHLPSKAAFRQLALQATVRIVQPAPVD